MAHFAKISDTSQVLSVLTLNNKDMLNAAGVEDESVGKDYLQSHNNWPRNMWIQTSYNTSGGKHNSGDDSKALRGTYAGIGYTWDKDNNIFYSPKPYASWVLNTSEARWQSPIGDAPDDLTDEDKAASTRYAWNEDGQSWDKKSI